MSIKLTSVVLAGLLSIPALAFADCHLKSGGIPTGNTFYGPTVCSGKIADAITINGPATLSDATMSALNVNGPVESKNSTITNLTVNGTVKLDNTTINDLSLKGFLTASKSTIETINAQGNLRFLGSKVGSITMQKEATAQQHTIYLCGDSIVGGDITFAGHNGVVYMDTQSKITGKVTGGETHTVAICSVE